VADHRHELALDAHSVFELADQRPEVGDHALERCAEYVRRALRLDVLAEVALRHRVGHARHGLLVRDHFAERLSHVANLVR
jgi:hypothetical protein